MTSPAECHVGLDPNGIYLGRYWSAADDDPSLVRVVDGKMSDVTSATAPTVLDLLELPDPLGYVRNQPGRPLAAGDWPAPIG